MIQRTFRQHALGFGIIQASATVTIDGITIYSGPIETVNQPLPEFPDHHYTIDNAAWVWYDDATITGIQDIEITVNSGTVIIANTDANNPLRDVDLFGRLDVEIIDDEMYMYPWISNCYVNNISYPPPNTSPWRQGQSWFTLQANQVLKFQLNVIASQPPEEQIPEWRYSTV